MPSLNFKLKSGKFVEPINFSGILNSYIFLGLIMKF